MFISTAVPSRCYVLLPALKRAHYLLLFHHVHAKVFTTIVNKFRSSLVFIAHVRKKKVFAGDFCLFTWPTSKNQSAMYDDVILYAEITTKECKCQLCINKCIVVATNYNVL